MSVLGTMMMRAGLLSEGQVTSVGELAAARSISHTDAILELGLADEDTLVAFLASKLMIPRVRNPVLERVGEGTIARVSGVVAWDKGCIPVSADALGNLTVVMSDPTDMAAIETLSEHTGAYLVRAVATASDIRRALLRHYGTREEAVAREAQAAAAPEPVASVPEPAESERPTHLDLAPVTPANIGIPDDDDDVPIRASHGAAEEVISDPHPHASPPTDPVPRPAAPYTLDATPSYPTEPQAAPYLQSQTEGVHERPTVVDTGAPPSADIHERPTVIETSAPSGHPAEDDPHERPTVVDTHQPATLQPPRPTPPSYSGPTLDSEGDTLVPPPPRETPSSDPAPSSDPTPPESNQPTRGPRRNRGPMSWNPSALGGAPSPGPEPADPAPQAAAQALAAQPPAQPPPAETPQPPVATPAESLPSTSTQLAPSAVIGDPDPLSPEAFAQVLPRLEAALERDEVTTVLLDFLGDGFDRVILFVHSHNELRGLDARGKDLLVEAVRQVRIPSGGASMFADTLSRGTPYFGPAQNSTKIDQAFSQALGGIRGNILLLPIKVSSKVPLLLWAHGTSHPVDPRSISELSAAVSVAILRIISARRKG